MFITNFSGRNTIWWVQKYLEAHCSGMPPVATGLSSLEERAKFHASSGYRPVVAIFAKYCCSFTWSDLNSKSFYADIRHKLANHNEKFCPLFQRRRSSGRAGGSKALREMEPLKNKKSLPIMLVFVQRQCWP